MWKKQLSKPTFQYSFAGQTENNTAEDKIDGVLNNNNNTIDYSRLVIKS